MPFLEDVQISPDFIKGELGQIAFLFELDSDFTLIKFADVGEDYGLVLICDQEEFAEVLEVLLGSDVTLSEVLDV